MIDTVAFAGYRSLDNLVLGLGELTLVTGGNGTGKSNVYRALRLLSRAAEGALIAGIAEEGGLRSALWAGERSAVPARRGSSSSPPLSLQLGFSSAEGLGYLVDLGVPSLPPGHPFGRDPEVRREQVFAGAVARPATLLIERNGPGTRVRGDGAWRSLGQALAPFESVLTDLADGETAPETLQLRRQLQGWRFYDHLRTDPAAPARSPRVATRTKTLSSDGRDLAAVWATIDDAGRGAELDRAVDEAFPGSTVRVVGDDGVLRVAMHHPGLLRPLDAHELSDGTLRYLLLCAALLSAEPAPLIVLNEPEAGMHPSLLAPLAALIARATARSQILVVTHSPGLGEPLREEGARAYELERRAGATRVVGHGPLESPAWSWGGR